MTTYQKRRSSVLMGAAIVLLMTVPAWAATGTLSPAPRLYVTNSSGAALNGACIWTYVAGTSTPTTTWTDKALSVANPQPVTTTNGLALIYLQPGSSYKYIVESSCSPPSHGPVLYTQDNIDATPASAANVDVIGTAGEAITAGQAVYLSDGSGGKAAGQWFKADQTNTYSSTVPTIGMAPANISSAASGTIRIVGQMTGLSSLTIGAKYYVGVAGAITSTAPANKRVIGDADSTTSLILDANPSTNVGQVLPTMTNGQLIIGSTGANPVAAALTVGNGLTTSTGAGTLTVTNDGDYVLSGCRLTTMASFANSAAENTLYTCSVPGGTLSTNRALHLMLIGDHLINNGAPDSLRIRIKLGATTICDGTIASINNGANRGSLQIDADIMAAGATNAQRSKCFFQVGDSSQNNAAGTAGSFNAVATYNMYGVHNAIAEDSTASKNLVVTAQMGTANASIDVRAHSAYTSVK